MLTMSHSCHVTAQSRAEYAPAEKDINNIWNGRTIECSRIASYGHFEMTSSIRVSQGLDLVLQIKIIFYALQIPNLQ